MITVKVSTMSPQWPLIRQTPGGLGRWGEFHFVVDQAVEEADYWVVYDGVMATETVLCPHGNVLLIAPEPPSIKRYGARFLRQFDNVISCDPKLPHPGGHLVQPALPWMVGGRYSRKERRWSPEFSKNYDELAAMEFPAKERLMSVIVSDKSGTPGHHLRRRFVSRLKEHFGERLDVFGASGRELSDKWEGIAPYRYHVALENSIYPHYWTEKLADAYLGGAFPFYHGCPNVHDYFPPESLLQIDMREPDQAIAIMERAIAEDRHAAALDSVWAARSLVLERYSLFPVLADFIRRYRVEGTKVPVTVRPEQRLPLVGKLRRLRNWLAGEGIS